MKPRRPLLADAFNIPNMLTFGRVLMIPVFLYFLSGNTRVSGFWAGIVFTLAALTDALDGFLARKLNVESVLGKLLDPLADKLMVMASLVWLVRMERIEAWIVVLLLSREFSITALRSVAASEGMIIEAGQDGKTKTALQMIGIVALCAGYTFHMSYLGIDLGEVNLRHVGEMLLYLSLVFSLASAVQYSRLFGEALRVRESKHAVDGEP